MHRYLVSEQAWLTDAQFTASIALSQAAPGPNVLFVALLGFNVGMNAAGGPGAGWHAWGLGMLGVFISMVAILLPSSVLTYSATRWAHQNRNLRAVRAFKAGMGRGDPASTPGSEPRTACDRTPPADAHRGICPEAQEDR